MGALARRGDGETLGTAVTDHERVLELGGPGAVDGDCGPVVVP